MLRSTILSISNTYVASGPGQIRAHIAMTLGIDAINIIRWAVTGTCGENSSLLVSYVSR